MQQQSTPHSVFRPQISAAAGNFSVAGSMPPASFYKSLKSFMMKSYTIIMALFLTSLAMQAANPPVNEKVLKTFNRLFATAQDVQWRYTDDLCEANFKTEDTRFRVALDYNGNLIRTIRYYKKGLPPVILNKVNKKYEPAEIYGITEISDANGILYDIVLYEKNRMLRLIVNANGTITATHRFKRGLL